MPNEYRQVLSWICKFMWEEDCPERICVRPVGTLPEELHGLCAVFEKCKSVEDAKKRMEGFLIDHIRPEEWIE